MILMYVISSSSFFSSSSSCVILNDCVIEKIKAQDTEAYEAE